MDSGQWPGDALWEAPASILLLSWAGAEAPASSAGRRSGRQKRPRASWSLQEPHREAGASRRERRGGARSVRAWPEPIRLRSGQAPRGHTASHRRAAGREVDARASDPASLRGSVGTRAESSLRSEPRPPRPLPPSCPLAASGQALRGGRHLLSSSGDGGRRPKLGRSVRSEPGGWSPSLGTPCGPEQSGGFPHPHGIVPDGKVGSQSGTDPRAGDTPASKRHLRRATRRPLANGRETKWEGSSTPAAIKASEAIFRTRGDALRSGGRQVRPAYGGRTLATTANQQIMFGRRRRRSFRRNGFEVTVRTPCQTNGPRASQRGHSGRLPKRPMIPPIFFFLCLTPGGARAHLQACERSMPP